jgi:hypothetical protein
MFIADTPWWMKLWWKGVDIAANVISGVSLALLALGSWRLQQWWQQQIAEKRERDKEQQQRLNQLARLSAERDHFLHRAEEIVEGRPYLNAAILDVRIDDVIKLAEDVQRWMDTNGLHQYQDNWRQFELWRAYTAYRHEGGSAPQIELKPTSINDIKLPQASDRTFSW